MIALASDHVGLALKREIARLLEGRGLAYRDFGTGDETRCDYPVFGARVVGGRPCAHDRLGVAGYPLRGGRHRRRLDEIALLERGILPDQWEIDRTNQAEN